jgi:predicted ATPase
MLIEFRVENHRSIYDEQALSMAAASDRSNDPRVREVAASDVPLLPVVAIYGANASGKSNILAALATMRHIIEKSHRLWEPDGGVVRQPFAWSDGGNKPSLYEASFVAKGVRYQYGFVLDDETILEEWLYAWPQGRKQVWFERDESAFKFGEKLIGENQTIERITRSNSLFLSAAMQNSHKQIESVFRWFIDITLWNVPTQAASATARTHNNGRYRRAILLADPSYAEIPDNDAEREQFLNFLRAADLGIADLRIEGENNGQGELFPVGMGRVMLRHACTFDDAWLPLSEQSKGTQYLFAFAPKIFSTLRSGGLLIIDELESSLHPLIAAQIVRLFNDPKSNPNNAQMIFSTHDTQLLGASFGEPALRRDQVWFCEKNPDGHTILYPLTKFRPRKDENLERGYVQGRYGAIPFIGELPEFT